MATILSFSTAMWNHSIRHAYYATLTGFQAVKPSVVPKVLSDIVDDVDDKKIVVSIAAAVTIENIQSKLNGKSKVRNSQLLDVKQQDNFF